MLRLASAFAASLLAAGCASNKQAPSQDPVHAMAPRATDDRPVEASGRAGRRGTIQRILPQNVRVVVVEDGVPIRAASGVVIANGVNGDGAVTYVMTNAHVVSARDLKRPRFVVLVDLPTGDTQEFGAQVVALGQVPESDLAVLTVGAIALEPAQLATDDELGVGEDVVVVAAPYGRSLSVSGGIVSQIDFEKGSPRAPSMIKTDAAIGYGASGGGLFSAETGKLLGIVEGYRTAKVTIPVAKDTFSFDVPMPGETFVAPTAKIRRFLRQKGLEAVLTGGQPARQATAAR